MPITAPPVSSYTFCFRRVARFLGVADPNSAEGDDVMSSAPYTKDQIKKQICQSDVEICALIASVEEHPYRNKFFTEMPEDLANGARIPGYIGVHGGVWVNSIGAGGGGTWERGRLAQSFEHLLRTRDKYAVATSNVPASSVKLYWIENGMLQLVAGAAGRVYVPTIPTPDDTHATPTLATPKVYQWGIVGHTLATLRPVGAESGHRNEWANIWAAYTQMILSGKASLPEPERLQRIAQ